MHYSLDGVLASDDIRLRTGLLIFIYTGLRRGEVTGLRWQNINFRNKTITVETNVTTAKGFGKQIKKPKTDDSERYMVMPDDLVEVMKDYKAWWDVEAEKYGDRLSSDWLFFQASGDVMYPGTFGAWLNKVLNDNGIEHYTPHSLRHTNLSIQMANGVPVINISARAGHAKTSTTNDMYGHAFRSGDRAAADIINSVFSTKKPVAPMIATPDPSGNDPSVSEFKEIREQAKKLGFDTVDEYLEYKAYMDRKTAPQPLASDSKTSS